MITLITAAAAAAMTPTTAGVPRSINADGVQARYTRSVDADGTIHLRGRYRNGEGLPFHFKVRDRKVTGKVGQERVAFVAPGL